MWRMVAENGVAFPSKRIIEVLQGAFRAITGMDCDYRG